ncbi:MULTISPECIES: AI-2E family transporter [unclassified Massilia]|uniref:AI-2E family transporter n=1 Tax=unclassified Massilia TaxID=2609279 RepID=UPI00177D3402|nr:MULTISPECIES: AI-2E family transporter [unclassified Massilia]MBD8531947.1 AI-2E family transporter [Massilia sp. CFBP 13647]MBD8675439.1 AI-2E family transporter [Massilia sp. CFBP 13721]
MREPASSSVHSSARPVDDTADTPGSSGPQRSLMKRTALVDGISVLFILGLAAVWFAADALLLVFACILCAVLLYELSDRLAHRIKLKRQWSLALVVLLLFAAIGLGGWAMAPQISEQSTKLAEAVPKSLQQLQSAVNEHPLLKKVLSGLPPPEQIVKQMSSMVPNAGLFFTGVLGAIGNVVIILFVGIYFAASPHLYTSGAIKLVPQSKRGRARQVLQKIGRTLASWLLGKSVSMLIVGTVTSIGLSLLGVPLALILGIIAGLLDFVPYLGPIMAGVPAVLIAFSISPDLALYTVLLFAGVQLVEGYVLQPLIESRAVDLPPALTIVMQLVFGTLFGFAGVALATPLAAALKVLVQMLYVEDVLGDKVEDGEKA